MTAALRDHASHGDYGSVTDGAVFAERVTLDLRAISHDLHLLVHYGRAKPPSMPSPNERAALERTRPNLTTSKAHHRAADISAAGRMPSDWLLLAPKPSAPRVDSSPTPS
jgi:hypothetical protein